MRRGCRDGKGCHRRGNPVLAVDHSDRPVVHNRVVDRLGGMAGSRKDHAVLETRSRSSEGRDEAPLVAS
jgi:hypothetical protein